MQTVFYMMQKITLSCSSLQLSPLPFNRPPRLLLRRCLCLSMGLSLSLDLSLGICLCLLALYCCLWLCLSNIAARDSSRGIAREVVQGVKRSQHAVDVDLVTGGTTAARADWGGGRGPCMQVEIARPRLPLPLLLLQPLPLPLLLLLPLLQRQRQRQRLGLESPRNVVKSVKVGIYLIRDLVRGRAPLLMAMAWRREEVGRHSPQPLPNSRASQVGRVAVDGLCKGRLEP